MFEFDENPRYSEFYQDEKAKKEQQQKASGGKLPVWAIVVILVVIFGFLGFAAYMKFRTLEVGASMVEKGGTTGLAGAGLMLGTEFNN
jgi:hypothetical protein